MLWSLILAVFGCSNCMQLPDFEDTPPKASVDRAVTWCWKGAWAVWKGQLIGDLAAE